MGRNLIRAALVALLFVPIAGHAADETPYPQLFYRDIADPKGVLGIIRGLVLRRRPDSVLVVFDAATFAPPPGMNEFNFTHDFPSDIPAWLDALEAVKPPGEVTVHAATTLSGKPLEVGKPGWRESLLAALRLPWWSRKDLRRLPAAPTWISRLLSKVPGYDRRMLVLVTGEVLPEMWADHSMGSFAPEKWRRKLLDRGAYWNEEVVAAAALRYSATLDIVAPEARFGDFLPVTDIPEAPWAARPTIPIAREVPDDAFPERARPTEEDLVGALRETLPDASEEELREMAKRILETWDAPPPTGFKSAEPAYRFNALTPVFCPHYGSHTFFNTDCPSRYGYWPFARAAAATGGRYLFYPFKPVDFLDTCPYDPNLLRALAPEYDSRRQFVSARDGDPALQALCRATRLVIGETPWSDGSSWFGGGGRATGWLGFARASPLALEKRYRERSKPFDWLDVHQATVQEWKACGKRIARVVPLYDKAIEILDNAAREIAEGKGGTPHRRSLANLRLARFWFEMSAFHLHALSLYLTELEKHVPQEVLEGHRDLWITYVPTIRMSDCLSGYEGVSIPEEMDEALQDRGPLALIAGRDPMPKTQSNILQFEVRDPRYRALRHPRQVMKKLDQRLKPRALRMIDAGAEVMRQEGRSPWGWMVYYCDACTFIYYPVPSNLNPTERPGVDPPDGATTPRPNPRARGPGSGG
jgi:hypothetical protein